MAESTPTLSTWHENQLSYSWLWSLGLGITGFFTALTNLFVILAVWKDPNRNLRRSPSNYLIASQAMADFFVGAALEPACIWWFCTFENPPLVVIEALSSLFSVASIFHMVSLAYDRHVAVVTPMQYVSKITPKRACGLIAITWAYCVVYMVYRTALRLMYDHYLIVNILSGVHTVLPAFVGLVIYAQLYYVISKHRRHADSLDESGRAVIQAYRRQRKMTMVFLAALLLFLFCMTPWFVFYQIIDACMVCRSNTDVQMYVFCFFFYLFTLKSLLNPFLYAWRLGKYREAFRRMLPWCRIPRKVGESSESSQSDMNMERSLRRTRTIK